MTKEFEKYKTKGNYHWHNISKHPVRRNSFVYARYEKCMELLRKELKNLSGKRILDMGCGDGVLTYKIFLEHAEVYGIDPMKRAIRYAREAHKKHNSNAKFFLCSGQNTHFEDNLFDGIVLSDVIEHIPDHKEVLYEIKRILKSDGVGIISTPIRFTQHPLDKMHVIEWFNDEFIELIESVFPKSKYYVSHPLFWYEFMIRSIWHKIIVNLISYFCNLFLSDKGWKYFTLQYAVVTKKT